MGEGNVFSLSTSGGYPYPIMLCNITQNAMGQLGGTLPGPAGGYPGEGILVGGTLGVPWQGDTLAGGTLARGTLPGGYPAGGVPCQGVPCLGGTQVGQHREYLLHSGRYASCVHAGGLSCTTLFVFMDITIFVTKMTP